MTNSVIWEFWASISGLEPAEVFTLEQHQADVFGKRVGETLPQAARRVLGPTGSVTELNAFFVPYLDRMDFTDLFALFPDTTERFYLSQRTVVRENLVRNPAMRTGGLWTYGGANTVTPGVNGFQFDAIGSTATNANLLYPFSAMPFVEGDTVSGSYEVEVPMGYPAVTFQMRITGNNGTIVGSPVTLQPGMTKTLVSPPLTASAGDTGFRIYLQSADTIATGSRFFVRNGLAEKASVPGPYFDGDTPAKLARNIFANPSFEVTSGPFELWRNLATNPSFEFEGSISPITGAAADAATVTRSDEWAASGAYSLRLSPNGEVTHSRLRLSGYNFNTFQAGKTYTVMATLRLAEPQTGTSFATNARTIDFQTSTGVGNVRSAQSPNEAGEYKHRITFTVPATGVTWGTVLLVNGASLGNGDVWWDDILIVEGAYDGPYFDGSASPDPDLAPSWLGTANDSVSILQGLGVAEDYTVAVKRPYLSSVWSVTGERSVRVPLAAGFRYPNNREVTIMATARYANQLMSGIDINEIAPSDGAVVRAVVPPAQGGTPTGGSVLLYGILGAGFETGWWDNFAMVEGNYSGPYFDGTNSPPGLATAWEGAVYNSASYLYDPQYTVMWSGGATNSTSLMVKYND